MDKRENKGNDSTVLNKSQIGKIGKKFVIEQLKELGYNPTDSSQGNRMLLSVKKKRNENLITLITVKTTHSLPKIEKLFSNEPTYQWIMGKSHESFKDKDLVYCFIYLKTPDEKPICYVVSSKDVSEYVKWQHEKWLKHNKTKVEETTIRRFRIEINDKKYLNNWKLLEG